MLAFFQMEWLFSELKMSLEAGGLLSAVLAILLAYLGGILSSFTPCIYPMIPITMGFMGAASERNVKRGWFLSSLYVLGMAMVYTILGLIASLSGRIFGSMTNTTGWYLSLGVIMALCSMWMMDIIQFDPNVWLSKFSARKNKLNPVDAKEGATAIGAFVLGASSGFIAAPCTTPVLTTILSYIATQGSIVLGMLLMFFFALGLGTILVAVGTFTTALKILPKSGKWLETVKKASGFLILGFGMYFIFKAGVLHR